MEIALIIALTGLILSGVFTLLQLLFGGSERRKLNFREMESAVTKAEKEAGDKQLFVYPFGGKTATLNRLCTARMAKLSKKDLAAEFRSRFKEIEAQESCVPAKVGQFMGSIVAHRTHYTGESFEKTKAFIFSLRDECRAAA